MSSSIGEAKTGMAGSGEDSDDAGQKCQAALEAIDAAIAKHEQAASDSDDSDVQERLAKLTEAQGYVQDACDTLGVATETATEKSSAW
jgi:hypothetical protein